MQYTKELAQDYSHAIGPHVTQSKDPSSVRHTNGTNVRHSPVLEDIIDVTPVIDVHIHAHAAAVDSGEQGYSTAHGGRVHDGQGQFRVLPDEAEEDTLVQLSQGHQIGVLSKGIMASHKVHFGHFNLLFNRTKRAGHESMNAQQLTFPHVE